MFRQQLDRLVEDLNRISQDLWTSYDRWEVSNNCFYPQPTKKKETTGDSCITVIFFVIVFIMDRVMYSWELTATAILSFFLHVWRLFWGFHSRYFRCFFHWTRQVGSCSVVTWPNPKVQIHDIFAASSQMAKNRCRARGEFFGGLFFCGWIFLGYLTNLYWKLWKKA